MDYTYYTGTWRDKLTSYDGNNISHAGIGNLKSDRLWTYTWEHGRELSSMTWRGASIPGYKTETEGETKNGLYLDSDGEVRYYVDGEAIYAGLVYWEGYYYYINSSKKAVQNVTYTTSTTNGLLPIAAYTFDEYGRMMDPPDGSYGRLAGTEDVTITYQYDANGMRTGKTVTRTDKETGAQTVHAYTYIYNGGQLSQMTVDGHTLRFSYDSGKPMFVKYDGVTYQYILNLQGDVIGIMNHAGTVVVEYVYDAWGNILSVTGSHASTVGRYNPLRYRSYVFDSETGLYYLQSRYYNPEWGRFINADALVSTGQGILGNNMFAYCNNNPVNFSDPTGELTRGQIHDLVLEHIIALMNSQGRNLSMHKTTIYYNCVNFWRGWGFCDLYDPITGEVWELKRKTCSKEAAKKQLIKYTTGRLKYDLSLSLSIGGFLFSGEHTFSVKDGSTTYYITYSQGEDGLLWYDYYTERDLRDGAAKIAQVVMALILLSGSSGGGGSAQMDQANTSPQADKISWAA